MFFFRYLVINCFDIDLTSSFFDYIMFVTNIYAVSIWFGDKIYQWKSKVSKLDWGFKTDYILSRSSLNSLLCLAFISLFYYFIVIPYFIPFIYSFLLEIGVLPRTVHAESPEPEAQGANNSSTSSGNNPSTGNGSSPATSLCESMLRTVFNPSDLPAGIVPFSDSGYYYKTPCGIPKSYYWGQYHSNALTLYRLEDARAARYALVRVEQPRVLPFVLDDYYVYVGRGGSGRVAYNPTSIFHANKELQTRILVNNKYSYTHTGIYTPSACPIAIPDHYN